MLGQRSELLMGQESEESETRRLGQRSELRMDRESAMT